jgi:cytochrome c biogenesis protein CcdA
MQMNLALRLLTVLTALTMIGVAAFAQDTCSIQTTCEGTNVTAVSDINQTNGSICIYFFYGQNCPHCASIEPFVQEMAAKHPQVELKPYEIYFNSTNQAMFNDFVSRYGISMAGVPAAFIGDRALVGESVIRNNLEQAIQYFIENGPICPETYNRQEGTPHDVSPASNLELTVPTIVLAALVDSINPCAFAVLIFLLLYLTSIGDKAKMLKIGIAYISAVFVTYFLSGFGLFAIIQTAGLTRIVYTLAAVLAIGAGIVNVKDFFFFGRGISLSIPESRKPTIKKYVEEATMPAGIALGFLVSLFELPCTGGIYLAILGLLGSKMTVMQGIPYLLLYNLIFILPLIVIFLIVYRGLSPEQAETWRKSNRKWMRLVMGILMIGLGAAMLLGMV